MASEIPRRVKNTGASGGRNERQKDTERTHGFNLPRAFLFAQMQLTANRPHEQTHLFLDHCDRFDFHKELRPEESWNLNGRAGGRILDVHVLVANLPEFR